MKAAVLRETGKPPVYADVDEPVAGEGQVVVEMAAAAIHHVDLARASGSFYLGPPPLPSVLGNDDSDRPVPSARWPCRRRRCSVPVGSLPPSSRASAHRQERTRSCR